MHEELIELYVSALDNEDIGQAGLPKTECR